MIVYIKNRINGVYKYKDHDELNNKLTNEDMNSILNSGEYRPKRKRRFIN